MEKSIASKRVEVFQVSEHMLKNDGEHVVHVIRTPGKAPAQVRILVSNGVIEKVFLVQNGKILKPMGKLPTRLAAIARRSLLSARQRKFFMPERGRYGRKRPPTAQTAKGKGPVFTSDNSCFCVGNDCTCWTCMYKDNQLIGCYEVGGETFTTGPIS